MKSNNLYAIQVIPLSYERDSIISEILGIDIDVPINHYISYNNLSVNYIRCDIGVPLNTDTKIRTWKTKKGAEDILNKVLLRQETKIYFFTTQDPLTDGWRNPDMIELEYWRGAKYKIVKF